MQPRRWWWDYTIEQKKNWLRTNRIVISDPEQSQQTYWSTLIHQSRRATLLKDCNSRDSVRLRCQDSAACSAWSRAPPSAALGTKMSSLRYQTMLKWHLGIPILKPHQAGHACPLCGKSMDIFGDHAVTCSKNNLWKRHYLVKNFLLRLGRAAGLQIQREQSLLSVD